MTNLFTAKPFISHDGPDENKVRAEVQVSTGYSTIADVEDSDNGKSKKVSFNNPKSSTRLQGGSGFRMRVFWSELRRLLRAVSHCTSVSRSVVSRRLTVACRCLRSARQVTPLLLGRTPSVVWSLSGLMMRRTGLLAGTC